MLALASMSAFALDETKAKDDKSKDDKKFELTPYTGPKKRIAVMYTAPSNNSDNGSSRNEAFRIVKEIEGIHTLSDAGNKITEMLTTALVKTNRFTVLERKDIQDIRDEIKVGEELGNAKTAVKAGSVLGAEMLVRCAVTEFIDNGSATEGGISLGGISLGGGQKVSRVTIDLRFYDASTSRIVNAVSKTGDSKQAGVLAGLNIGSASIGFGGGKSDPIERATRNAIERAVVAVVQQMDKVPWTGRVASIDKDGNLLLNRGEDDGLKVGDELVVCTPGEDVTDPDTGEVLERAEDTPVGTIKLTWIGKRVSKGTYSGSKKAEVKMVVKTK